MRIAIDAHAIGSRLTGNERYIENLVDHLLKIDSQNEYFLFFTHEGARLRWAKRAPNAQTLLVSNNPFWRLGVEFPRHLRNLRADVFHYQYTGPAISVCPELVTIHDVSFERYPEIFSPSERYRLKYTVRKAARKARKVITVSEFSKSEILHFYDVEANKVKVIYNGVGSEFDSKAETVEIEKRLQLYGVRRPYILSVGNVSKRKNHRIAVAGFARWLKSHPGSPYAFVVAGKPSDAMADVKEQMENEGLDSQRLKILGYVAEQDLPFLYGGAGALLNMSYYEGFGLPLVEAMRAGVPVIASRASCFPEIVDNAGRLVEPTDAQGIADALQEVLGNQVLRDELIGRARQRVECFCWELAAKETLRVYYEASQST
jgi:glycosyltransferase involved in cell wall biosynthesis